MTPQPAQVLELVSTSFEPPATPEANATPDIEATPVEPVLTFEDFVEVGFTSILSRGQVNWLTFDLAPATYAELCFVPTPVGKPTSSSG